jgi:hypothetical protein
MMIGLMIKKGTNTVNLDYCKENFIQNMDSLTQLLFDTQLKEFCNLKKSVRGQRDWKQDYSEEKIEELRGKTKILKNQRGFQTKLTVKSNLSDYIFFSEEIKDYCERNHNRNQPRCSRML